MGLLLAPSLSNPTLPGSWYYHGNRFFPSHPRTSGFHTSPGLYCINPSLISRLQCCLGRDSYPWSGQLVVGCVAPCDWRVTCIEFLLSDYTLQFLLRFPRVKRQHVGDGDASTSSMAAKAFSQSPQNVEGNSLLAKPSPLLCHGLLSLCHPIQTQVKQTHWIAQNQTGRVWACPPTCTWQDQPCLCPSWLVWLWFNLRNSQWEWGYFFPTQRAALCLSPPWWKAFPNT